MSIRLKYANLINIDQVKLVSVDVDKVFLFGGQRFTTDDFAQLGNKSTRITARTMRLTIHNATFDVQSGGSSYLIEVPSFALDHAYHYVPGKIIGDFDFKKYFTKNGQRGWDAIISLEKNLSGGLEEYYVDFANPKIKPSPDEEIDVSNSWWSSRVDVIMNMSVSNKSRSETELCERVRITATLGWVSGLQSMLLDRLLKMV